MRRRLCYAKLADLRVTHVHLDYEGSLGVDGAFLEAAGVRPYEAVLVANKQTGERFETYVIPEPTGSGRVALYGGAARRGRPGDELILMFFADFEGAELAEFPGPRVLRFGPENRLR